MVVQRAQLAAAPLTKNEAREKTVKFIDPPFMTFGLSILMRKGDLTSNVSKMIDLDGQDRIKYGLVGGGSTASFFKDPGRRDELYRMWIVMDGNKTVSFLDSVEAGVRRVRESTDSHPFAFIGEKYMLEYHASREPCDLMAVDGDVAAFNGEYHLAVSNELDADIRNQLADALKHLNDTGRLDELYRKWWIERDQCVPPTPSSTLQVTSGSVAFTLLPLIVAVLFRVSGE